MLLDIELDRRLLFLLVHLDLLQLLRLLRGQLLKEHESLVVVLVKRGLSVEFLREIFHVKKLNLLAVQFVNELLEDRAKGVELVSQVQGEQVVKFRIVEVQKSCTRLMGCRTCCWSRRRCHLIDFIL